MKLIPTSANILIEVFARIDILVIRVQIVKNLRGSMHTGWAGTHTFVLALILAF